MEQSAERSTGAMAEDECCECMEESAECSTGAMAERGRVRVLSVCLLQTGPYMSLLGAYVGLARPV